MAWVAPPGPIRQPFQNTRESCCALAAGQAAARRCWRGRSGLAFFFAPQGAGRLRWPLIGSFVRLGVALAGGALAVAQQSLAALYGVIGLSFLVYALVPGIAFRLGAWAPDHGNRARG
ncbi:MAG: hypothetical protein IPO58_10795 [Betaproteobacteria bacterium]|nr:hypothetical protein [Betaproteobacteria bacterium]MBK9606862.1 hypothetical protein [Betaproteobacteria bacterium]